MMKTPLLITTSCIAALAFTASCSKPNSHEQGDPAHERGEEVADHDKDSGHDEDRAHAEDHGSEEPGEHEKKTAGPNGGRIITGVEPHLEFLVTEDRKVRISVLDDENKAVAVGAQSVTVTGGSRANPTRLAFAKEGEVLVSDGAFPEGNDFPVVVQIQSGPDAVPVIEKFNLNLSDCPTCEYREYACVCDHDDEEHAHE